MENVTEWKRFDMALRLSQKNVLVRGEPSTSKTYHVYKTLDECGRQYQILNMTAQTSKEDAYGHFIPTENNTMKFMYNAVTRCMENGWVLVINEIDKASYNGEAQDILYYICESMKSCRITLPDGRDTVRVPKPGYRVIATMNSNFDSIPGPVLERFPIKVDIGNVVSPWAVEGLPRSLRGLALSRENSMHINLRALYDLADEMNFMGIEKALEVYFPKNVRESVSNVIKIELDRTANDRATANADYVDPRKSETPAPTTETGDEA